MTLVNGGNVKKAAPTVNPSAQYTTSWTWVNAKGESAKKMNWWFQDAFKQGAVISRGSYHYTGIFKKRLRALDLQISGEKHLVDALHSIMERLAGRG